MPNNSKFNIIGTKWVFKIKRNSNGAIERYKTRLVAQGFKHNKDMDYGLIYGLVVKPSTIRIVLSLAVNKNYTLRQIDVKNDFLQGELTETIYIAQPLGFIDSSTPTHVCKLNKAFMALNKHQKWCFSL